MAITCRPINFLIYYLLIFKNIVIKTCLKNVSTYVWKEKCPCFHVFIISSHVTTYFQSRNLHEYLLGSLDVATFVINVLPSGKST